MRVAHSAGVLTPSARPMPSRRSVRLRVVLLACPRVELASACMDGQATSATQPSNGLRNPPVRSDGLDAVRREVRLAVERSRNYHGFPIAGPPDGSPPEVEAPGALHFG